MRLIDADKIKEELKLKELSHIIKQEEYLDYVLTEWKTRVVELGSYNVIEEIENAPTVEAIPIEQLLNILPKYDDYIHTKTYPYNETLEDIYSKGHEDGWNACLRAIKEELDYWEKENE